MQRRLVQFDSPREPSPGHALFFEAARVCGSLAVLCFGASLVALLAPWRCGVVQHRRVSPLAAMVVA